MRVTLWGTRGSHGSIGADTMRYGGNTACVEVRGADGTHLVLDAGTGMRRLGAAVGPEVRRFDILLSHLHMDHVQGLGFFGPLNRPDLTVHIWGPPSTTLDLRSRLNRYLSPPLFPVTLRDLRCRLEFHDLPDGPFSIGGLDIWADLVCHPGPTVGYRITEGDVSMAYLPDHEPALGARVFPGEPEWTSGFAVAAGVDLLIHDTQFAPDEYERFVGWGHSSIDHAVAFANAVGAARLVTFHYDPLHDDATIDRLIDAARRVADGPVEIVAGLEGDVIVLGE